MKPFLFVLFIFAVFFGVICFVHYRRGLKTAASRPGQGFDEFIAYFSGEDIFLYKLRDVYELLQKYQFVKNFPVHAEDDLYKVYGICDEELEDIITELAESWRVKLPTDSDWERMGPVRTVADLVRLLSRLASKHA